MERRNKKTRTVGNGEGSLYYSEKLKCWIYQYYVKGDPKRKSLKQRKNEQVKAFKQRVTDLKNKLNNGTYIEKSKETLHEIIKRHIEQKLKDGLVQEVSYLRNLESLSQLEKTCSNFIYNPIQKITVEMIEDAKSNIIEYSQSSIDKMWILLNKGFKIAYSRRKITFNIMEDETLIKPISKKPPKELEALTIEEETKLRNILDNEEKNHKYRNITKLELMTGMRIGEILARSSDDFDDEENTFTVNNTLTKNKQGKTILGTHTKTYVKKTNVDKGKRILPLNFFEEEVKQIIQEQISKKITNIYKLLFWDYENNTFISREEINSWLSRLNTKYNISPKKLSSHILRHTFITRLRESGIDMKVIQYIVGHVEGSSITDNVYTTLTNTFVENEMEKYKNKKETKKA